MSSSNPFAGLPSRPLLLGHRGARASPSVTENTIAAFDLCLEHGCDGFEFDVRRTADGVPVVCHDATFGELKLAEASAQDLEPRQARGFLPTLEQVLRRFGSLCFLDIEIKDLGLEAQVLELLRRYPPVRNYVVTSFRPEALLRLRELDPRVPLGFLLDQGSCGGGACSAGAEWWQVSVEWVLPERTLLDVALAKDIRKARRRVGTWTVNEPAEMLRLASLGAEILISDDTTRLVNTFPVI